MTLRVALDIIFFLVGGGALYWGAEWLVDGASQIAKSLGISPLIVGLTVVAYGTSAPELAVSITAVLSEQSGLALGNVIGSNIANLGLVLGITAVIASPRVSPGLLSREVPWFIGATAALWMVLFDGEVDRLEGGALVAASALFTWTLLRSARKNRFKQTDSTPADAASSTTEQAAPAHDLPPASAPASDEADISRARAVVFTLLGLVTLPVGGNLFVTGSVGLARILGIDETVIGMTVVAVGTSMPELAASVVAALRGHADMAVGNVLGSNLFNILLVVGATALTAPLLGSLTALRFELFSLAAFTLIGAVMVHRARQISRAEGLVLLAGYGAFLLALLRSQ